MTLEQIIEAWRAAGKTEENFRSFHYDFAQAIAAAARAEAIEECAKLCDGYAWISGSSAEAAYRIRALLDTGEKT